MLTMMRSFIASRAMIAALLALGAAERVLWLVKLGRPCIAEGEAPNLTISLARSGQYADAFAPGSGPSAHVLPLPPLIASVPYHMFGVRTPAAEALLASWSIGLSLLSFLLLYLVFKELGAPRWSRLAALAVACLLPLNFTLEACYFRIWEGALAVCLGLVFLLWAIRLDRAPTIGWRAVVLMACGAALIFFIAPQLGIACYACAGVLMLRKLTLARWPGAVLAAGLALALLIVPWTIRNQQALGEPVWLRSNFGLELSLGMNPAALQTSDQRAAFAARMAEIHPYMSPAALERLKAMGGEVPYSRTLGAQTRSWMAQHPGDVAMLMARHLGQMMFPPAWFWQDANGRGTGTLGKLLIAWGAMAFALAWMAAALWRGPRERLYPVLMVVLPILPYMITQPILRYRYPILGLTLFMACEVVAWAIRRRDRPAA